MSTEKDVQSPHEEDDLEDGEIDSSDEDVVEFKEAAASEQPLGGDSKAGTTIDLTKVENVEKKSNICESRDGSDDFADNLEKTMAAILKKEGIVPKIPEIVLEKRKKIKEEEALAAIESSHSKASRRRKRKKVQKEKDREKDLEKVSNLVSKERASIICFFNF